MMGNDLHLKAIFLFKLIIGSAVCACPSRQLTFCLLPLISSHVSTMLYFSFFIRPLGIPFFYSPGCWSDLVEYLLLIFWVTSIQYRLLQMATLMKTKEIRRNEILPKKGLHVSWELELFLIGWENSIGKMSLSDMPPGPQQFHYMVRWRRHKGCSLDTWWGTFSIIMFGSDVLYLSMIWCRKQPWNHTLIFFCQIISMISQFTPWSHPREEKTNLIKEIHYLYHWMMVSYIT